MTFALGAAADLSIELVDEYQLLAGVRYDFLTRH
jgi:hypothetical protein